MNKNSIPFFFYLKELKYNLFIYFFLILFYFTIFYFFSNQILYIILQYTYIYKFFNYFIFTNLTELFLTKCFNSLLLTFFVLIPILFLQIWFFFSNGFYKYENFFLIQFFFFFFFLYVLNIYICFKYLLPYSCNFFLNFKDLNIEFLLNFHFEPKLNFFFSFLFKILIYLLFIYLYFIFAILLLFFKKIKIKVLTQFRKFFYIKFLIIASLIAPPDLFSQIFLCIPLIFLFEFIIFILFFNKN